MAKNTNSAFSAADVTAEMKASLQRLSDAQKIVDTVFGASVARDHSFILKVYDYLEMLEDSDVDSDELIADLKHARKIACDLFKTEAPSADEALGVFDRLYVGSDE